MYKDMLLKLTYYREEVLKAFVKRGYFPKEDEINNRLENIDKRLALFKSYNFQPGELLNLKELNHCLESIYKDLIFLYKILEEISIQELSSLKSYTETHMTYLEDIAKHFKDRAEEEVNSTTLGTTIFFKSGNWDIDTKDDTTSVKLGDLDLIQGSQVACFANINNVVNNSVKFVFDAIEENKSFEALPYNYNNSTYKVPGDLEVKTHELVLSEEAIVNGSISIPMKDLDEQNDYYVLGGKNLMLVTYKENNTSFLTSFCSADTPYYAPRNCYITFYIAGGKQLEYNFNKKPLHTNFSLQNGIIKVTEDMQKVFLDVEEGFVCSFNVDEGDVWASKEDGIVKGNNLIYNGDKRLRDFEIKEYVKKFKTRYSGKLLINSEADVDAIIENVYIKEL